MAPLNLGFVGTGIFATDKHLPTFQKNPEHFKPIAAFNRTRSKAETFAEKAQIESNHIYDSLDDILKDPKVDFIDALLPAQNNNETIQKAIQAGKPIIVEKPIAADLKDAQKIVQLSRETELPILIGEQWIYFKSVDLIKERLEKIGPIISFTYRSTGPFYNQNKYLQTSWRQNPKHIGGFLSDGGVHQLALLTEVLGEVSTINAHTKQVRKESGTDDILFSTVKLENDVIGTFTYGSAFGAVEKHGSFIIYGLNGSITLDFSAKNPHKKLTTLIGTYGEEIKDEEVLEFDEDPTQGVGLEFENFYQAVTTKDKSILKSTPEKTYHHLAIIAAALESSQKNGDTVEISKP
ncbi:Inositol 2-dehydrogenase/D-chiro-inositol 3-dehydrogenase [Wickerhamomyces ciferrii]|uniref:Inositol 2-dehydrogenase/D-chiro-inositol 3-dehydrogenase n=1 Tax=Wickerhamomyces ciferrii (strain ATCC 14091 / BCRC 22168 / CBS 111 / JCM 3599 / NBRC 0793 / NRRL Y-1031 F-60-10) TaxID=1206466 RepID=K0KIF0_WICCF|nr:Inositol 2-dehydrogenase/D-chiro-inositol 3-dehydrogenase [Wickerhamomyces ciferrii]CCH41952.1 Inositol 2-dehydrogenase/D-chiro-inositol 3-dehydrogenase [Wickerhamomyces ciferrii]